ncbi:hypothetical protein CWB96_03000 [Pseudoalteromonas citrea]|uniref:Uncharacterized protein n=1 Tax=Pseudoalteromonas citrea TaxID=43655 RepID=A0A5S3XVS7_9GAMM|nr:hypothetical protein CWB97_20235 [Pseudoalteromonas citrea]TMP61939.1 hypothetical protein CWB96_03000 [Pseudoalteromonas citrea]
MKTKKIQKKHSIYNTNRYTELSAELCAKGIGIMKLKNVKLQIKGTLLIKMTECVSLNTFICV